MSLATKGAPPPPPSSWILPNRAQFLDWVPSAFKKSLSKTAAAAARLFPHQAFVRDYLQHAGPYRGMLLYHGLGAGKTCAAITTSTKLFEDTDGFRKPVVLLPASLRQNFIDEIKKCGPIWMRPQQEWVFMPDAEAGEKVHPYAPPPGALVTQHGGLWVPASLANLSPSSTETKTKTKTKTQKGQTSLGKVAFDRLSTDLQNQIRRQIDAMIDAHYTFYAYNGLKGKHVTALEKGKLNLFDHKVIIVDEVHNFISSVMNGRILIRLYQLLMEAKDAKMILLSGTPIINRPNELSYIMNLATGYMPVVTLRYQTASTFSDERVKTFLKEHPHVDDAELRDDDNTITLTLVPDGFERASPGAGNSYGLVRSDPDVDEAVDLNARVLAIKDQLRELGLAFADDAAVKGKKKAVAAPKKKKAATQEGGAPKKATKAPAKPYEVAYETRLPFDAEAMTDRFLNFETSKLKNPDMLARRLLGAVSYFHTFPKEIYPTLLEPKLVKAKMTDTQFSKYSELRDKEIEIELRAKKNKKKRSGSKDDGASSSSKKNPFSDNGGVYRTFSRALCNFVFPESIPRPFPYNLRASARELDRVEEEKNDYRKAQEDMKDAANDMVEEGLIERTDMDEELDDNLSDTQSEAGDEGEDASDASDSESGESGDEDEEDEGPSQRGGAPKEAKSSKSRTSTTKKKTKKAPPAYKKMAGEDFQSTYLRIIAEAKAKLAANPVFLTTDLGEYSPKMAKMIKTIQKAPGSCLVYSQFRMVEGLGVLSLALDAHGFVELKVRKTGLGATSSKGRGKKAASGAGSWELDLAKADYNKPKYIRFTSDKEATKILMDIFNSNVKDLPPNIAKILPELHSVPEDAPDAASRRQLNLYGSIVKVMMVTQSGSEGISLKNVRQVHVMEPYWNDVRIKQVIGRAVRAHSHVDLPDEDRNVQVFMYQSVLDEEMARKNYRIRTIDQGTTSDAFVAKLAQKKKVIVDQLMDVLRRAAVDCRLHASTDCFKVPSNWQPDRRISPAAIALEQTDEEQSRRLETRTTKVTKELKELLIKGRRYYYEKGTEALYDVEQSKAKGKLVQVGHMVIKQNPETGKKVRAAIWDANA